MVAEARRGAAARQPAQRRDHETTSHTAAGLGGSVPKGIWSLLKRSLANFAAPGLDHLVRIVKRKLKKIQYRPHLMHGCLAATGGTIEAW